METVLVELVKLECVLLSKMTTFAKATHYDDMFIQKNGNKEQ
jgi:hypothetical protein